MLLVFLRSDMLFQQGAENILIKDIAIWIDTAKIFWQIWQKIGQIYFHKIIKVKPCTH